MGKRAISIILSLALMIWVMMPQCSAAATNSTKLYFMAVNETIYPSVLEDSTMPVTQNGLIYVPYRLFDSSSTGIALGTYCIFNQGKNVLVVYTADQILTFDLNAGTATDQGGNSLSFHAITRNSTTYVPVYLVAHYFGLQCDLITTEYGALVRVTNSAAWLSNDAFASAAVYNLQARLKEYQQKNSVDGTGGNTGGATDTPSNSGSDDDSGAGNSQGSGTDTGGVGEEDGMTSDGAVTSYLAFRVESDTGLEDVLSLLSSRGLSAIFFFSPETLGSYDDQIRSILIAGHQIGFLVSADQYTDTDSLLTALEEGNDLLRHIAQIHTHFVLADGGDAAVDAVLDNAGWLRWSGAVTGNSSTAIVSELDGAAAPVRITLSVSNTASILAARVLNQLEANQYAFLPVRETAF